MNPEEMQQEQLPQEADEDTMIIQYLKELEPRIEALEKEEESDGDE